MYLLNWKQAFIMDIERSQSVEVYATKYGMQNPEILKLMLQSAEEKNQELKACSNHKQNNVELLVTAK